MGQINIGLERGGAGKEKGNQRWRGNDRGREVQGGEGVKGIGPKLSFHLRQSYTMDGNGDDTEAGEHFPGQRDKSRIYKLGPYFFHREKIRPSSGTIYYRCTDHLTSKCKVRAKSGLDGVDLVATDSTRQHTHSVNPYYETYLGMKKELVQLCMQQKRISMDKIYCNFLNR